MTGIRGGPPSSRINSVNFAVSTVCAYFTDSPETGKVMTLRRIIRRHPAAQASSEMLGFFVSVLLLFRKNMKLTYQRLSEMSLILIEANTIVTACGIKKQAADPPLPLAAKVKRP